MKLRMSTARDAANAGLAIAFPKILDRRNDSSALSSRHYDKNFDITINGGEGFDEARSVL
jgi:hypothetical protein